MGLVAIAEKQKALSGGFHPAFLGFGLQTLWVACLVRHQSIDVGIFDTHTLFYGLFGLICLVTAAVFWSKGSGAIPRHSLLIDGFALVGMLLATLLLTFSTNYEEPIAAAAGCFLGACGSVWMLLRWGNLFKALPIKGSVFSILASYSVHFLGFALFIFLIDVSAVVFLIALSIFSVLLFEKAIRLEVEERKPDRYYGKDSLRAFWKLLAACFIYGLILGMRSEFSLSITDPFTNLMCQILASLVVVCLMVWVFIFKKGFDFSRIFQILLIIIATGFFLYPFSESLLREVIASMFVIGVALIYMLMWLALADVVRHSAGHPFAIVGVWGACYGLPRPIASFIADTHPIAGLANEDYYLTFLSLLLVYGLIICTAFLLGSRPRGQRPLLSSLSFPTPLPELFDTIDERCEKIGNEYGLTAREIEVIQYMTKGRSKGYIADSLYLSENTIKSYAKKAYAKLGVHSKQDLLDLLGLDT